uniref:Small EDRK-rich factor 2-like n=1 Tax=Callorhinchus milii TaxID=7868 RepID=A0A4W3GRX1_CALMI
MTESRELARQKNAKKSTDQTKGRRTDGLSAAARKQRDAEIMQQKQQAAAKEGQSAPKGGEGGQGASK